MEKVEINLKFVTIELMNRLKNARDKEEEFLRKYGANVKGDKAEELQKIYDKIREIEGQLDQVKFIQSDNY